MKAVHSVSNKRQKNIILVIAIILIVLYYLHPRQRLISTGLRQYEKSNKHRVHLRDVIGVDFEKIYNCDNNEYLLKQDGISNLKWITIPINSSSFFFILRNRIVYFECFSHKGFDEVIFEKGEFFFTF